MGFCGTVISWILISVSFWFWLQGGRPGKAGSTGRGAGVHCREPLGWHSSEQGGGTLGGGKGTREGRPGGAKKGKKPSSNNLRKALPSLGAPEHPSLQRALPVKPSQLAEQKGHLNSSNSFKISSPHTVHFRRRSQTTTSKSNWKHSSGWQCC